MFAGREEELAYLEEVYSKPGLKTCSVLGRRGVGKSSLLEEFCKGKRSLRIQFVEDSKLENMIILNIFLSRFVGKEVPQYKTLSEYFDFLGTVCSKERIVVVFDEFPYLQRCMPEAASVLQMFLDVLVKHTETMVIICGSSISMMKNETESMSRPLYGRFVNRITLKPLDLETCRAFHPGMNPVDQISVYLTVGGIPRYQEKMGAPTFEACIMNNYVLGSADMTEAGPEFIRAEIENAAPHIAAVSCIANGSVRQKEIAEKLGIDSSYCKKILDKLEEVGIIGRVNPMFGAPKKPTYYIEDNIVAFHYYVVGRIAPLMSNGSLGYSMIEKRIDDFLGKRFELLCREFLLRNYHVKEIGKWWGSVDSESVDTDIVAKIVDRTGVTRNLFCECKYSTNAAGFGILNTLARRVEKLGADNPLLALFSVNGFEEDLMEYSNEHGILLFDSKSMFGPE